IYACPGLVRLVSQSFQINRYLSIRVDCAALAFHLHIRYWLSGQDRASIMLNSGGKAGMDQKNSETLAVIGEAYSAKEGYALFGRYCLHKEAGLNKAAISAIREFVV